MKSLPTKLKLPSVATSAEAISLDMLRLDEAARALRAEWAYQPGATIAQWEDISDHSREAWRKAAAVAIQTYGDAA